MRELFYVYEHLRNDTNEIFYVGKGSGNRYKKTINRNNHWHNIVDKVGFTAQIIFESKNEELAYEFEIKRIKELRDQSISLVNYTDGGEGGMTGHKHSAESIEKMRILQNNRSDEHKNKIREANQGENNPNFGNRYTDEFKRKLSEAQLGEKNHNFGKKATDKTRARMSKAHKGKKVSDETRAKLSAINKGRKLSAEHIEKIREALLARPKVTCPYCEKEGVVFNMTHWHFDNCQMNPAAPPRPKVICPHCRKEGDVANMTRWHFDNCKKSRQIF